MDYYEEKFRESGKIIRMLWRMLLLTLAFTLGLCVITLLESCKPIQKVVAVPDLAGGDQRTEARGGAAFCDERKS